MMATMMATTTAATAIAAVAAVAAAAATMTEGHRLVVTAQEGDADDREENRETKNNNTVHPQILQLLTGTVSETTELAVTTITSRQPTAQCRNATKNFAVHHSRCTPIWVPVVKFCGLRRI